MSSLLAKSAKNFSPLYTIHHILHFSDSALFLVLSVNEKDSE